ncbi:hypothetical protein NE237_001770 [Protea cynaroides]|uniref:F-box domain-containing protein n=1 Tax=Protea cynaroides TaxID=273540 RepID=A0A9Q0QYR9_9MAGN|nr:hypothetical protein NE237_001770 [Protea cynaroides]
MTGRKMTRKTHKPVRVGELRAWSELPIELLELIFFRLCIDDNVRFSCVCKKLRSTVRSLCVVNQSPWLLYLSSFQLKNGIIRFFDPSQGKFYFDDIPELRATRIHCSKDGWLLFSQLGDLLYLVRQHPLTLIFAIGMGTGRDDGYERVSIGIYYPGDAWWTTFKYQNTDGVQFHCGVGPIFCNGLFYCFSDLDEKLVGVFPPMNFRAVHMVEVEMEGLNGATVFVSSHSSISATNVPRISRNSVYFSKYRRYGKSSYFYSFDDCRFHPAIQRHEVPGIEKAVWIEPP